MKTRIAKFVFGNQFLTALFVVAIFWVAIEIKAVLTAIFISYILMAALSPYVEFLQKLRLPKVIAVLIPYLIAITFIILLVLSILPFFVEQVSALLQTFPSYLNEEINALGLHVYESQVSSFAATGIESIGRGAFSLTSTFFGGIFSAVTIFAISFYLLLYRDTLRESTVALFPKNIQPKVRKTTFLAEEKLGNWLRGQFLLSGFIGALSWIVLTLIGVKFALPLALIAAVFELIPTIGPILSAIPGIIVALSISWTTAIIVALAYFVIQMVENHILVPRVMQRAVGLNPIVIIIGIITGGKLLGPIGAFLAIPFISLLVVVYKNLE